MKSHYTYLYYINIYYIYYYIETPILFYIERGHCSGHKQYTGCGHGRGVLPLNSRGRKPVYLYIYYISILHKYILYILLYRKGTL